MGKIHPVSRLHGQSSPPKLRIPVRSTFISHFLAFPLATSSDSSPKSTALYGEQFSFRERLKSGDESPHSKEAVPCERPG